MNILAGIIVLSISILVHELGHLFFGKLVGIKAKVFSFGFGKGIFKKEINGTTYQVTAIPLGGYVQFYGDDIANRDESKPGDFFYVSPLKRIIPVIGGPLFNLILGISIFAFFNFIGFEKPSAKIMVPSAITFTDSDTGEPKSIPSPAGIAGLASGDTITYINGEKINTYLDIKIAVIFHSGSIINIEFIRNGKKRSVNIKPVQLKKGGYPIIGVQPFGIIGIEKLLENGPFAKAGLKNNDLLLALDNIKPKSMGHLAKMIQTSPRKKIKVLIKRQNDTLEKEILINSRPVINFSNVRLFQFPQTRLSPKKIIHYESLQKLIEQKVLKVNDKLITDKDDLIYQAKQIALAKKPIKIQTGGEIYLADVAVSNSGYAGVVFRFMKIDTKFIQYGFFASIGMGFLDAWNFLTLNIKGIIKLFSGDLSISDNLSGPIKIAKMAGDVAEHGAGPLFLFLAQISVVLMIMNLLPIPVVDGGHIVLFILEAIMGKPLNPKIQERITATGIIFLVTLGVYVIFNDLLSLDFIKNLMQMF